MKDSRTLRKLLLTSTLLILSSVIATGVYTQASKSQKKEPARRPTYDAAKVTTPPEVRSKVKGVEIVGFRLVNQGTPEAVLSIDVTNNRDEAVMALDFVSGKNDYSGLSVDGLLQEGNPMVVIPPHTLKTFTWFLGEIMEGETVFLAAAVFSDGKEEGDKRSLDGMRIHRQHSQQNQRDAKAKNGGQF
jgi:hypothetical protein